MKKITIYESKLHTRSITTDNGLLKFHPGADEDSKGVALFGQCDISDVAVQKGLKADEMGIKAAGLKPEQIDKLTAANRAEIATDYLRDLIEGHDDFTTDPKLVGVRGIWPKELRESAEKKAMRKEVGTEWLAALDDAALRAQIKAKGGKVASNASHEQLVAQCAAILEGNDDEQPKEAGATSEPAE